MPSVLKMCFHRPSSLLLLGSMLLGATACAQGGYQRADPAEIARLDSTRRSQDFGLEKEFGDGFEGSGDGEEPPGYHGEWWGVDDGEHGGHRFHNGDLDDAEYSQVVILELSSMNGGEMPKWIGKCRNLRELRIDYGNKKPLPAEIWSLPKLEVLELDFWEKSTISSQIGQLKQLKRLDITGTYDSTLTQIPAAIGKLQALEWLSIESGDIAYLPVEIFNCSNLKYLKLRTLNLKKLPQEIGKLTALDSLDLTENHLTQLPSQIGNLSQLTALFLQENQLASLPPQLGNLQQLEFLSLRANALKVLPTELGQLRALQILDVSDNQLSSLPESIGELHQLQYLVISQNRITDLPSTIGGLTNLERLLASSNQISTLPKGIGEMQRLNDLWLDGNALVDLPAEIVRLNSLRDFRLDRAGLLGLPRATWDYVNRFGTKISKVPTEIAGKPLAYYLAHPKIDAYSKRLAQGDLAMQQGDFAKCIGDSLLTNNPETAPFYLYLFAIDRMPRENDNRQAAQQRFYEVEELATAYILERPCDFMTQVKTGPYQLLYSTWINTCKFKLYRAHAKYSELFLALRAKMEPVCGDRYDMDLLEMVKAIKLF